MKVIVKRYDEEVGHMAHISNTLRNLQKIVGGYIEAVAIGDVVIICDEEGLIKGKPFNCKIPHDSVFPLRFFGDIIVCSAEGEDFTDIDISLATWKRVFLGVES